MTAMDRDVADRLARTDAAAIEARILQLLAKAGIRTQEQRPGSLMAHQNEGTVYFIDVLPTGAAMAEIAALSRPGASVFHDGTGVIVSYAIGSGKDWPHASFHTKPAAVSTD